jgi:hypothetical protein
MSYWCSLSRRLLVAVASVLLAGWLGGCNGEPAGASRELVVKPVGGVPAQGFRGAPGEVLAVNFRVVDEVGLPVPDAVADFRVKGEGASVVSSDTVSGNEGRLRASWKLGVRATEQQQLTVVVHDGSRSGVLSLAALVVPHEIASLALPDSVSTRLHSPVRLPVFALDPYGNVFIPDSVKLRSSDPTVFTIDTLGTIRGRSRGFAQAIATVGAYQDTTSIHIFQIAASITVPDSAFLHSLGQSTVIPFTIVSDSGEEIRDTLPVVTVGDTSIATVVPGSASDSGVRVRSVGNGAARMTIAVGPVTRQVLVLVQQQAHSLTLTPSTPILFDALGDSLTLTAVAKDSLGNPLTSSVITFTSEDSSIVAVNGSGVVWSRGNGATRVMAREATGAADSIAVTVAQVVDSIEANWSDTSSVVSVAKGAALPLTCVARDRNGFTVALSPIVLSVNKTVAGRSCDRLTVQRSGLDTLILRANNRSVTVPTAVTVFPLVSSPLGNFVTLDSLPSGISLWAPSARTNSAGETEVYVTGYAVVPDSNGIGPGALHRLKSADGVSFRYDGVALTYLPSPCGLICTGIENMVVIRRQDAPGWRMLFAAGSSGSYGWQVFSAVSDDERTWTMEPGVRVTNGGTVPPAPPMTPPWPVGEGFVVDLLPTGEWRMVVGGYERVPNPPDRFEIVEYRSADQMTWTYHGLLLSVTDMPVTAQRSIYSPTIVQFVPGLWRMYLTGDDLNLPAGRSRVFSAVSRDRVHWEFEAELLGAPGTDLYYTALVNNRLYFLRQDAGDIRRLATATVTMP